MSYKYFKPDSKVDNFGEFYNIDPALLRRADELREAIGHPVFVTSGYRRGDPNAHGKGLALDLICPGVPLMEFYKAAEKLDFSGLGVYPHWKWKGTMVGGLHVDIWIAGRRWMGIRPKADAEQIYIRLSPENLKKYLTPSQT